MFIIIPCNLQQFHTMSLIGLQNDTAFFLTNRLVLLSGLTSVKIYCKVFPNQQKSIDRYGQPDILRENTILGLIGSNISYWS